MVTARKTDLTAAAEDAAAAMAGAPVTGEPHLEISQFEFLREPPTRPKVLELLRTVPDVHGIRMIDFADFVQALPADKKIKVPHPTNPRVMVDQYIENWVLYVSVGGRVAMINAAAELNDWTLDFRPEKKTPTGAPGFISLEQRIVYREYAVIHDKEGRKLGSKPGQAWVPFTGGTQAKGSNPYEKVETAARGRSIAAWRFGVLPGSGIASVEEMQAIRENRDGIEAEQQQAGPAERRSSRASREELIEHALTAVEDLRQRTSDTPEGITEKVGTYLAKTLGAMGVYDPSRGEIHWDQVKDGHLVMMTNFLHAKSMEIMGRLQ